ncbi:hypothetical protein Poli38472_008524 [Pythium oligandrum]|uniref:Uncharacterized protein n=1 Tax=Pythium oligandrum TaxID=41045 RepID=A0A8K1FB92_PYTOL|nr:hypothetical protein Poli38472_008524 [Pythium oligandrum]|eukprot:TMW55876.1 hypothetical protein Poli38472_008524 [Pythium oligandrum]
MNRTFRPPMDINSVMAWKTVTHIDEDIVPGPNKPIPEGDSDNDTESASSADFTGHSTQPAAGSSLQGVGASLARAGKMLWNKQLSLQTLRKQTRSASDFSESDFSPFAIGTPVYTRFGLGSVAANRDDGITEVTIQGQMRATLYTASTDEEYYAIPAIRHDWVETPFGEGNVIDFDPKDQTYTVRVGGDDAHEQIVTRSEVRRAMPVRRQTYTGTHHHTPAGPTQPSAIQKGLNTAYKTIVNKSSGISSTISNYYYHGQCVITNLGEGQITSLDQTHHRAIVQMTNGATAYISTDQIRHYTKALKGMEVTTTKFGSGIVTEVRAADSMYTVRLHDHKEDESEFVYVHESDLVRGKRTRLGSAQRQMKDKLASTSKLLSSARGKLFGGSSMKTEKSSPSPSPAQKSPSLFRSRASSRASTRTKSVRVVESDSDDQEPLEEPSSAGI